jgi:hypothetical protein
MVCHTGANMAYSVLAVLGVCAAWQALLSYVGLLVLAAGVVIVIQGPHLTGRLSRPSLSELHEVQVTSECTKNV